MGLEQVAEGGRRQEQGLHIGGGAEVLAGLAAQEAGPAGQGARADALQGAQPASLAGGAEAAHLAAADQQHALGEHIGAEEGLAQAEAAGLQQGIEGIGLGHRQGGEGFELPQEAVAGAGGLGGFGHGFRGALPLRASPAGARAEGAVPCQQHPHPFLHPVVEEVFHDAGAELIVQAGGEKFVEPQHHPAVSGLEGGPELPRTTHPQPPHQAFVARGQGQGPDAATAAALGARGELGGQIGEGGLAGHEAVVELLGQLGGGHPQQGVHHLVEFELALQEGGFHLLAPAPFAEEAQPVLAGGEEGEIGPAELLLGEPTLEGGLLPHLPLLQIGTDQGPFLLGGQGDRLHQLLEHPGAGQAGPEPLAAQQPIGFPEGEEGATGRQLHHGGLRQAGEGLGHGPLHGPGGGRIHGAAGSRTGRARRWRASAIRAWPRSGLQVARA